MMINNVIGFYYCIILFYFLLIAKNLEISIPWQNLSSSF